MLARQRKPLTSTTARVSVSAPVLHPGAAGEVALVLHVTGTLPAGWRLFFHVRSAAGFLNLDHEPVAGFVPLARLRPGHWVRDRVHFTIPPSWNGPVSVEVGLWKGSLRAPAHGPGAEGDHVTVARLTVAR